MRARLPSCFRFNLSGHRWNSTSQVARPKWTVAGETHDVIAMDNLLKSVRLRSDPTYHSVMPMRSPALWSEILALKDHKPQHLSESQLSSILTPRPMHDSYAEFVLPFASSPHLLDNYVNAHGGIRTGKLMEHLDSLAGSIAYKHVLGPSVESLGDMADRGFYIVTASVDRLDMLSPLDPGRDLRLSGQVIYTGTSSMEIAVRMEQFGGGKEEETVMLGRFSMVCRDAYTHKARAINPLVTSTPEEEALKTMDIKLRRHSAALQSLDRVPPSSEEAKYLHEFHLNSMKKPLKRVWMANTRTEKCMLMFPQERNVHGKIFGGYLMRLAYELGFANGSMFTQEGMRFLSLDGISFAAPVSVGDVLRLRSHIVHSTRTEKYPVMVHVRVTATTIDVHTSAERLTNTFKFTWARDKGPPLDHTVVPETYREAMRWLEGKRALDIGEAIRALRESKET